MTQSSTVQMDPSAGFSGFVESHFSHGCVIVWVNLWHPKGAQSQMGSPMFLRDSSPLLKLAQSFIGSNWCVAGVWSLWSHWAVATLMFTSELLLLLGFASVISLSKCERLWKHLGNDERLCLKLSFVSPFTTLILVLSVCHSGSYLAILMSTMHFPAS